MMHKICFLSGLEIPKGKFTKEHYVPKSRTVKKIWNDPRNIFPAAAIINHIKSNLIPCEWEDSKWEISHKAVHSYHLRRDDKEFVIKTIKNWETYIINPCQYCLLKCKQFEK